MKKKLKCILIVDDDDDCNFFHKRLLNRMDCAEEIMIATDGQEALDLLCTKTNGEPLKPGIIFLDINMPVMDGWEFLEEYSKLPANQKAQVVLIMLTTSLNPEDKKKALNYSVVSQFQNKLLTEKRLNEILKQYFPDHL